MKFKSGEVAFDKINKFYVVVEGRDPHIGKLRYYDVTHLTENEESHFAAGPKQLRKLMRKERGE
jgi:hypothetical protein